MTSPGIHSHTQPGQRGQAGRPGQQFRAIIANPSYRRLWGIGVTSTTMRWMETVALGIFVFELTGSPFWVAIVGFLRMVPMLLLSPTIGLIADRTNRKILMGSTMAVLSAVYVVMGLLVVTGLVELWHIMVGVTLSGVMWSTDFPVRRAMIGDAVGDGGIATAIGMDMATSNFSRVIGPLGAGAFLATLGVQAAYFTGAILFAIGSLLAFSLPYVAPVSKPGPRSGYFANLAEGLRHVRADRIIVVTLVITITMNVFGFPYQHMIPVIGAETLKVGPLLIGLLLATEGLGATTASLIIALKARPGGYTRIFAFGSVAFLVAILMFSISPSYWMALPALLIGGFSMAGFGTMQSIIIITSTPAAIRGRVLGVLAAMIGTGPFGALIVGVLAVRWSASSAVTAMAITGLVLTILPLAIWPAYLRSSVRPGESATGLVTEGER
ncbi:MAG: MFS transporter [Chloroflexi bacterium]|nr:MFS transporter [Chloroflexota bacterium]